MPLDLRPGEVVPIPCRHCQKSLIRFTISDGSHALPCPRCAAITQVEVYLVGGTWQIRTDRGPSAPRSRSQN